MEVLKGGNRFKGSFGGEERGGMRGWRREKG